MSGYRIERTDQQCRVVLLGDLTASIVPELQAALRSELEQDTAEVVVDLGGTALLDSSGIGLLIAACNSQTRKQGRLCVTNVSNDILQLLKSMRLVERLYASGREA